MEFRLTYRGGLKANGGVEHKQEIRRVLHPQLAELWRGLPLCDHTEFLEPIRPPGEISLVFPVGAFQFVPLVSQRIHLICHLEILFLRREQPGSIVTRGGDIDNRLKTLLDALRMPNLSEIPPGDGPQDGENPFFCLLEDDALVTRIGITTDRLLDPGHPSHVSLVLQVVTKATKAIWGNIGLGS